MNRIDIVVAAEEAGGAIDAVAGLPAVERLRRTPRGALAFSHDVAIGIQVQHPSRAGATWLQSTGSRRHHAALQRRARARGWRLDRDGLLGSESTGGIAASEEAIYAALDLPFIAPEIRDGREELDVADRGALPRLLERRDIRGDLHMHSTWSDGHDSIEMMASTCRALGYEYIAITDHSARAGASRTLTEDDVQRQAEEIAAVRARVPGINILHGCEVDIMPSGELDFADHVLEAFDIVLVSLHQRDNQSADRLLQRYANAARHPLVSLITHPTNRLVPYREGYDIDYDRLFEIAVETGTILEIDGAPGHLDMNGPLAKRAIAAGVTVAVDSDCHRADALSRQMQFGITMARRGWVEPPHVINTRSLDDVRAVIAGKRRSAP